MLALGLLKQLKMSLEINKMLTVREYFEIRNMLNRNNKTKNEKSELIFELKNGMDEYYIIIKSSCADHGLRLATYDKARQEWQIFINYNYASFYKYMFQKIRSLKSLDNQLISEELAVWLNSLWVV